MSVELRPSVTLETCRCNTCGRWWALEAGLSGNCPRCAYRKSDDRADQIDKLERSIRSLRGALTKAKARSAP